MQNIKYTVDGIRAEKIPCKRMELRRHSMNEIEYAITNFEEFLEADIGQGYGSQKIGAIISRLREVSKPVTMAWKDFRSE